MVMDASGTLNQEPQRTSLLPNGPVSPSFNPCFMLLTPLTCAFPSSYPTDHQGHKSTWSEASPTNLLVYPPGILEKGPLLYPQEQPQFNFWKKKPIKVRLIEQDIPTEIMKNFILSNSEAKGWIKGEITIFLFNLILRYDNKITCAIYPKVSFLLICL